MGIHSVTTFCLSNSGVWFSLNINQPGQWGPDNTINYLPSFQSHLLTMETMPSELCINSFSSSSSGIKGLLCVSAEQSRWGGCGQGKFLPGGKKHILSCTQSNMASRLREAIVPLCSHETCSGVLHPALGPPTWEGCGSVRMSPQEGHKDGQMPGEYLLWRQAGRVGVVLPGETKASGRPYSTFQCLTEANKRAGEGPLKEHVVTGQGMMASSWKRVDLD